jgi:hypothetical protein
MEYIEGDGYIDGERAVTRWTHRMFDDSDDAMTTTIPDFAA